jgi:hypothetical protein
MIASSEPAGPNNALAEKWNANSPSGPRRGSHPNPATVLTAIGICSVVLGGLVAAVTGPLELAHGNWLAAYLVLVGGVTQYAMGQARLRRPDVMQPRRSWAQIGCWNLGNAMVIGGTLAGEPLAVDLGSAPLVIALAIAFHAARSGAGTAPRSAASWVSPLIDRAYQTLLLVLALSIPAGMVLSHCATPDRLHCY